jgi:hypothetical protein
MADHGEVQYATATGNDYPEHEATYETFVKAASVGTVEVLTIVVALAIWGVTGHWGFASLVLIIALVAGLISFARGSSTPSIVGLVVGLLVLAMTAY